MRSRELIIGVACGVAFAALCAGCASVAVDNDAIESNTANALGLARGTFAISNREDSGIKTSYQVKTNGGKQYNCYVTRSVGVSGPVVSDAICSEMGKAGGQATGPSTSCNALLRAAGKCN